VRGALRTKIVPRMFRIMVITCQGAVLHAMTVDAHVHGQICADAGSPDWQLTAIPCISRASAMCRWRSVLSTGRCRSPVELHASEYSLVYIPPGKLEL
jgi:hypothetical protein